MSFDVTKILLKHINKESNRFMKPFVSLDDISSQVNIIYIKQVSIYTKTNTHLITSTTSILFFVMMSDNLIELNISNLILRTWNKKSSLN